MSNHQEFTGLNGGLVRYDAVFWYPNAEQTGTDGTQTTDYYRVLQSGDDRNHQWTANKQGTYCWHPKECCAKQQAPDSAPESALPASILHAVSSVVVADDLLIRVIILPHN
jgi:hypothetical protein